MRPWRLFLFGWFLGGLMQAALSMAWQDSKGGVEAYCAYLRDGHWWNTPWWLWAGVWIIGWAITITTYYAAKR